MTDPNPNRPLLSGIRAVKEWWAARRELATLEGFSADALKDIGLSRGDLPSVRTAAIIADRTRRRR